jgi:predicted enzyme related to lactoylglutathione lyase
MISHGLSALTFQSADPAKLAAFYRDAIGLPLAEDTHGTIAEHFECDVEGIHFAVLKASARIGGPVVPVFRVASLDASCERMAARGVPARHKPMELGNGLRVVTFEDPDGNAFRLIEVAPRS